jgi:hypothetical protein
MKLQDQVCTIEQALIFEKLGVRIYHEGQLKWTKHERYHHGGVAYNTKNWHVVPSSYLDGFGHNGSPHAINCAELGIMMPPGFGTYYSEHLGAWMWQCTEPNDENESGWEVTHSDNAEYDNEAEARAAAVIYALENKLTTVEELNNKLRE